MLMADASEAACRQHANEMNDAMNAFHNAAKSYKKSEPEGQLAELDAGSKLTNDSCRDCTASMYQTFGYGWKLSPSRR